MSPVAGPLASSRGPERPQPAGVQARLRQRKTCVPLGACLPVLAVIAGRLSARTLKPYGRSVASG